MPGPQSDPTVWPRTLFLLGVFQENVRRCQLRVPAQLKECNRGSSKAEFYSSFTTFCINLGLLHRLVFDSFKRERDGRLPGFNVIDAHFETTPNTSDGTFCCLLMQHSPTYFFGDIFLDAAEKHSCSLELGIHISIIGDRYLHIFLNSPKRRFLKWRERQLSVAGNVPDKDRQCQTISLRPLQKDLFSGEPGLSWHTKKISQCVFHSMLQIGLSRSLTRNSYKGFL